ncbi:hypothetical protein Tco_0649945 [Tanacetum coccineum]
MQGDKVNIQIQNSGNDGRNTRCSFVPEEIIEINNVQNDAGNIQRTLRTTTSGSAANVQCYNCSEKAKHDEAGVTLTDEQNDFLVADATWMEEIEELSANICLMARIQPTNIDSDEGPSYDSAFLSELNALYEDFVPQKEFSAKQKYFSSSFISSENSSNASSSSSSSETKPTVAPMPSTNPMKLDLNNMENEFQKLFALLQTNSKRESIFYTSPEEIRLREDTAIP